MMPALGIYQSQIGFIHQRGRLQRVSGALVAHVPPRQTV
jgi:hypothetical protein